MVRDVCARKPDQRGRDLLLILDRMVKGRKKGDSGVGEDTTTTLVMTLAMDGIAHLCRAGLIDIRTTLKVSQKSKLRYVQTIAWKVNPSLDRIRDNSISNS